MPARFIIFVPLFLVLAAVVQADNLYEVKVPDAATAAYLNEARVEPVLSLSGGYLVLAGPEIAALLESDKIKMTLVAKDIARDELYLGLRLDGKNPGGLDVIYKNGVQNIYRLSPGQYAKQTPDAALMPIRNDHLAIICHEPTGKNIARIPSDLDLLALIGNINQDSLYSYDSTLQAFGDRYTGSASNNASRDWIASKFVEFGYDSIVIDSFVQSIYGVPTQCQNVYAFKSGTAMLDNYIIVGAHRDAVSGSPGADDNGSGTSGVLEIARVLKDIPTDLNIMFALYDAEEQGLYGSWHHADEAAAAGDSIVYMFNMDMIGYMGNTNQAKLYYGSQLGYSNLCHQLADSLLGYDAVMSGSLGASDHHPYIQNGYEATLLIEYNFSSVYHTYQDSTTYMDFSYMANLVKIGLATVYTVSETFIPGPELRFTYPDGVPEQLVPGQPETFGVTVVGINDGVPLSGTGQFHYAINGGGFVSEYMTETGANEYNVTLPALSCGDIIQFYFSAEEATSGTFYNPGPLNPYSATPVTSDGVAFYDDFEQDNGWTVSGGQWQRGAPTGGGGAYGSPDPVGGYNSANCFGYNLSGDYTNNMPEYNLTSPAIDCSGISDVQLSFMRWLGVEQPSYDHAYVKISTNGTTWTTIWENTAEVTDASWNEQSYDISAYADNQPTVYIRFVMGETDVSWTYCGWNIDDVTVSGYICDANPEPVTIITEDVPDWTEACPMAYQLIATGGVGGQTWTDKYGDLTGTGISLSATGMLSGSPSAAGEISFTAEVTDAQLNSDLRLFTFMVNDILDITSTVLPDAVIDQAYSHQLTSSGGTGVCTWSDVNSSLDGTGLALSPQGLLSGTPLATGKISFLAEIADEVGATDQQTLAVNVVEGYLCGDANNDDLANIGDAVYLINYVFKAGPAPQPLESGDANCDGAANVADAVYLINYIFKDGPVPCADCP